MFCIKWINKYSGEIGYVGKILKSKGHFVNSDKENAKTFATEKTALKNISVLQEIGEAENNDFSIETV